MRQFKHHYIQGQKIGELTFLNRVESKPEMPCANFLCQCGKEFVTRIQSAKSGKTKSCGCLQPKVASIIKNKYVSGDKIGELIYIKDAPYKKHWSRKAVFLCVCNSEFVTSITAVKNGTTKSCGCLTKNFLMEKGGLPEKGIPNLSSNDIHRFWSKVAITANPNICWNWIATGERYGGFSIKGKSYKSNRIAYFITTKIDPKELSVMHNCDNPKCCNPNHLSLGTHWENMQDMANKGRAHSGKKAVKK